MNSRERVTRSAKRRKITVDNVSSQDLSPKAQKEYSRVSNQSTPKQKPPPLVTSQRSANKPKHTNRRSLPSAKVQLYDGEQWTKDKSPAAFVDSAYQSVSTPDEVGDGIHNTEERLSEEEEQRTEHNEVNEDSEDDRIEDFIIVQQTPTKTGNRIDNLIDRSDGLISMNKDGKFCKANRNVPSDSVGDHQSTGTEDLRSVRSSGRQRKKTSKLLLALAESTNKKSNSANGSTRKRGRPKKIPESTLSQGSEDISELHFEDLPNKLKERVIKSNGEVQQDLVSSSTPQLQDPDFSIPRKKRGRPPKSSDMMSPIKSTISQPTILASEINEDIPTLSSTHEQLKSVLQENGSEAQLELLKSQLMGTLTGRKRMPLVGLEDEYEKVRQVVEQTVGAGEGNSMLILGARGSAKTTLVEAVILQMKIDHQDDFHVVRLNGFVHTDDKLALKEIWRQLGHEMEIDDATASAPTNYADTLASLLALLSHPDELSANDSSEDQTAKSVVFIIDEFDHFANHSRQTLLYNLFDVAQSRKAPIAVLGLTTKIDIVESLEKRVKSRFSHRYVHLSLPASFSAFRDICEAALTIQPHISYPQPNDSLSHSMLHYDSLPKRLQATWNAYISTLLDTDSNLNYLLRQIYALTKSVPSFFAACFLPILSLTPTSIPSGADFISNALAPPDSKLSILPGLSDLELSLLISAARLDIVLDTDTCNFNMAYDEYISLAEKAKLISSASGAAALGGGARVWGREVAMGAWERLEALELLVPALGTGGGGSSITDIGRAGKLWKVDVGLEEIGMGGAEMSSVMAKWCREL